MTSGSLHQSLQRVEHLLHSLDGIADAPTRLAARELVRALLNLHTAGIAKLLELSVPEAFTRFAADPLVSGLLLLHGLHPHSAEQRVRGALEHARPRFHAHGGDVELLSATDELVRLRVRGEPAAGAMLRALAEEFTIEVAPDAALEFVEAWEPISYSRIPLPLVSATTPPRRGGAP